LKQLLNLRISVEVNDLIKTLKAAEIVTEEGKKSIWVVGELYKLNL
jgi:hypothetical protein